MQKRLPIPNYAAAFEEWLGRRLNSSEAPVINALERQRQRGLPVRLIVRDNDNFCTKPIIIRYISWYTRHIDPMADVCLCASSRESADALGRQLPERPIVSTSYRHPEAARGSTFRIALLFDVDRYNWTRRRRTRLENKWRDPWFDCMRDILSAICIVPNYVPGTIIIVHTTSYIPTEFPKVIYKMIPQVLPPSEIIVEVPDPVELPPPEAPPTKSPQPTTEPAWLTSNRQPSR